jgi:putative component of toxin-antitoxin plasmid stabilization module
MSLKKKRKDYNHKEFAVGTKIEYNNKLYEVVKSNTCENCSISSFCSASDNYVPSLLIPRDKLLSTLGKCSAIDRTDGTSVVFKEIPKDDSKDEYYKISPLWAYNNPVQLRPIELVLPNGHEIDVESSDLSKGIIRFKRKWLSLEQMYNMAKATNYHTYLSEIKDSTDDISCTVRNKLIALANLMDIASYFNGGWEYDITKGVVGYSIAYYKFVEKPHYSVCKLDKSVYTYYGSPVFKNEADAQYVIDNPNFRDILDNIFKV